MRLGQYLLRVVVFACVAFDPSGGGVGVALAVAIGFAICVVIGVKEMKEQAKDDETRLG